MGPSEPTEYDNPRDALERQEEQALEDELAFAFSRILSWLLSARSVELVGFRAYVLAHKLRPDLIKGMTLQEIGELVSQGRSNAHNLSKELTLTFGIRGRNEQSDASKRERAKAWTEANPDARRQDGTAAHLPVVNRFAQWEGQLKRKGLDPRSPELRATLRRDFAPLIAFFNDLQADLTASSTAGR